MGGLSYLTSANLLTAFAYMLLLSATAPKLAHFSGLEWGMLPIWLILVVYVASILKNMSPKDQNKRFDKVVVLALFAYFAVCLVWPFPLAWYDSLLCLSLFASGGIVGHALQGAYYLLSAASYLRDDSIVQASARLILVGVLVSAIAQTYKAERAHNDETT